MNGDAEAVRRVRAKLRKLQAELAELSASGEHDPSYVLGWAEGGIRAALVELDVWTGGAQ